MKNKKNGGAAAEERMNPENVYIERSGPKEIVYKINTNVKTINNDLSLQAKNVSDIQLHSEQGTTASIYTGTYNEKKIIIKVFKTKDDQNQSNKAQLQRKAYNYLKSREGINLFHEKLKLHTKEYFSVFDNGNLPKVGIPEIIDFGPFRKMNLKYNLYPSIPISLGYVYLMEYIEEPTLFQDLKDKKEDKIELYQRWSGCNPNDSGPNYLQSILFALRDTLHAYGITHNDLQFKNIMVKFNQGNIDTMTLIDFGQAQPGNDEVGHDYEYNVFDIEGQLDKCRRWFPDKYNQGGKSSHKIKKTKKKVRRRLRSRKSKKKKSLKI